MNEIRSGDRVRIVKDIWDDGQDHHPAGYIAKRGEVVNVDAVRDHSMLCYHDGVTDGRRFIALNSEVEPE